MNQATTTSKQKAKTKKENVNDQISSLLSLSFLIFILGLFSLTKKKFLIYFYQ